MINLDFLSVQNNNTLNDFYNITEGKIILGGSSVLKINKIIDRNVGNLNLVLNQSDLGYVDEIVKKYKLTFVSNQEYGIKNKTYWFRRNDIHGVLFLTNEDLNYNLFNFKGFNLRVVTVNDIKLNKESLIKNNDSNSVKHYKDIESIEKFYGEEIKKSVI